MNYENPDTTTSGPKLLRVPTSFRSVEDVLGAAQKMNLPNALLISELENGDLVFLGTEMTTAETNWLMDRLKALMLMPDSHRRVD